MFRPDSLRRYFVRGLLPALLLICAGRWTIAAAGDPPEKTYPRASDIEDPAAYPEFDDAPEGAPTASLSIVFDPISEERAKHVASGETFDFYVVAHDVQVALRAWEARIVVDPRIVVTDRQLDGLNLGKGNEIITALKPKNCKEGTPITLAHFRAMLRDPDASDAVLGLAPISKSSFDPPSPGYLICRPGSDLRVFDACDTCAVVNPVKVTPPAADRPEQLDSLLKPIRGR
jgi:hypothetical protein